MELRILSIFLLLNTLMTTHAQQPFSTSGNCTEKTYGFVSVAGETHNIPPVYCDANGFSEGLAAVKHGEKWGYIDAGNNAKIDFKFDYAGSFKHDQAIVWDGKSRGVINKEGDYVIPARYLDLQALEIEGKMYYLSRDSSFFAGMIDTAGNEVVPHQFTYILPLESYRYIPFYTVFREIDTAKGSFHDQFEENPFEFSPENGQHDIYDLQFDKLASKPSTSYLDGFQHHELRRINAFLEENGQQSVDEKIKTVDSLLALPEPETPPQGPHLYEAYRIRESEEVDRYLDSLGYQLFTDDGKTGLKKGNDILIPAKHRDLRAVNGVILFPRQEDIPFLEKHYGGAYRNKEKGIFDVYAVIPTGNEPTENHHQHSLSGEVTVPIEETDGVGKKLLTDITSLGFIYRHTTQQAAGQAEQSYGLVNWKGEEVLPPEYQNIQVFTGGHMLVTQERAVKNGIEAHVGLFDGDGEALIPIGVYSAITPFSRSDGTLYLATWSDPYPTTAEKEASRDDNKTYVILEVGGHASRVVNTFTANSVYAGQLDTETGMLQYTLQKEGEGE